jgi:hypothetical protein
MFRRLTLCAFAFSIIYSGTAVSTSHAAPVAGQDSCRGEAAVIGYQWCDAYMGGEWSWGLVEYDCGLDGHVSSISVTCYS